MTFDAPSRPVSLFEEPRDGDCITCVATDKVTPSCFGDFVSIINACPF